MHCSREYVSGLIYVAVSRVRSPEHLQLVNFNRSQLLKPQKRAVEMCASHHLSDPVDDLSCCHLKHLSNETFSVQELFTNLHDEERVVFISQQFG